MEQRGLANAYGTGDIACGRAEISMLGKQDGRLAQNAFAGGGRLGSGAGKLSHSHPANLGALARPPIGRG